MLRLLNDIRLSNRLSAPPHRNKGQAQLLALWSVISRVGKISEVRRAVSDTHKTIPIRITLKKLKLSYSERCTFPLVVKEFWNPQIGSCRN